MSDVFGLVIGFIIGGLTMLLVTTAIWSESFEHNKIVEVDGRYYKITEVTPTVTYKEAIRNE